MEEFRAIFGEVEDPRDFNVWHDLFEVLFIAMAACLCGANSYGAFAEFGKAKEPLLRQFLALKHGTPSRHTFERVFRRLNPEGLEAALIRFTRELRTALGHPTAGQVVAMDGKRLRGAYDKGLAHQTPIMVCAYLHQTRLVLGQRQATDCSETKGLLQLLQMVALEGAIVTGDALHCSRTARRCAPNRPITCSLSRATAPAWPRTPPRCSPRGRLGRLRSRPSMRRTAGPSAAAPK
jgi:hypothetical protein